MDACFEERLCDEVRRYPHLYNPSLKEYKDSQLALNSWREIAETVGRNESACRQKWKYLRDRYVKAKRKRKRRSGDAYIPRIISMLDWLSVYVKHRPTDTESNSPGGGECEESSETVVLQLELLQSILDRLKKLDRDRAEENEETLFGRMVAEMLMKLPEQKRMTAKFEIHQMLHRMQKECCQED